jgi:hypothetical protein
MSDAVLLRSFVYAAIATTIVLLAHDSCLQSCMRSNDEQVAVEDSTCDVPAPSAKGGSSSSSSSFGASRYFSSTAAPPTTAAAAAAVPTAAPQNTARLDDLRDLQL